MAHPITFDGPVLDKYALCPLHVLAESRLMTSPWLGWFTGLSSKFLASRTARLLVLAGTERLDKELMIGQMQGKFQLVVIPGVGHMVHEVRRA